MADGRFRGLHPELLGDVIVSADTAAVCAAVLKVSPEAELELYLVHGILHLLGFTDKKKKDAARMKKLQEEILKAYA